jgi:hypothetical protein
MISIEVHRDFPADPVRTEMEIAVNLQNSFPDFAYVPVPWAGLLNGQVRPYGDEEIRQIRQRGAQYARRVSACQHIRIADCLELAEKFCLTDLMTPHATELLRSKAFEAHGMRIHSIPHYPTTVRFQTRQRDFLFSFMGMRNHPSRRRLAQLHSASTPIILRSQWQLRKAQHAATWREYSSMLSRTTFSLCPRGTGPGTLRVSESLLAGAIPVILSDGYLLPRGWSNACVQIPEDAVVELPTQLRKLSLDRRKELFEHGQMLARQCFGEHQYAAWCLRSIFQP